MPGVDIGPFQTIIQVSWNLVTLQFEVTLGAGWHNPKAFGEVGNGGPAFEIDLPSTGGNVFNPKQPSSYYKPNASQKSFIAWTMTTDDPPLSVPDAGIEATMRQGLVVVQFAASPSFNPSQLPDAGPTKRQLCTVDFGAKTIVWTNVP